MSLELIATPIGDPGDITVRAIETLRAADVVIGEERKEVSKLLKALGIEGKRLELLNEHTRDEDLGELVTLCRTSRVALVTDCGTPGFCDPGARLVALLRREGLASKPVPGASSLMCLLSVCGSNMREFLFRGFLPAESGERALALTELTREKRPVILMDTPYRMNRLLAELAERFPGRRVLLGCDFTQSSELIVEAFARDLPSLVGERKAEFILALFPGGGSETVASPKDRRDGEAVARSSRDRDKRRGVGGAGSGAGSSGAGSRGVGSAGSSGGGSRGGSGTGGRSSGAGSGTGSSGGSGPGGRPDQGSGSQSGAGARGGRRDDTRGPSKGGGRKFTPGRRK